jgi:hypothetical protein
MFDNPRYQARREVNPPKPVLVNLAWAFPPTRLRFGTSTPLWAQAGGLQLDIAQGVLSEWWMTQAGDWLGRCSVVVTIHRESVALGDLLIPKIALKEDPR